MGDRSNAVETLALVNINKRKVGNNMLEIHVLLLLCVSRAP